MAGLNMSQALQNIGANLPNIFRQRQQDAIALQEQQAKQKKDEEEATQQAELSRIITELKKGELEQSKVASAMGAEGRKAVDEYTTSRNVRNLPISREYGQPLSDLERAEKYSLPKYAPYEPSAKSIVGRIDETEKQKNKQASGLGMTTAIKREDWNKIAAMPDGPEKDAAIDNYLMVYATGTKYPLSEKGITERINLEESLIPVKSKTEASTTKAGTKGKIEGETEANQTAIPGFKPIQGVNITNDSVKKVKAAASQIETMKSLADDLINKYDKMGSVFTGNDAADYSSKVRNLQLMAKGPEFYNLGVLTGPDLSLLEETIPNPSSIKEGAKKLVLGDISVKLNNFKNMLTQKGDQFYRLNGFEKETPKQKKVYNPQTGKFELR